MHKKCFHPCNFSYKCIVTQLISSNMTKLWVQEECILHCSIWYSSHKLLIIITPSFCAYKVVIVLTWNQMIEGPTMMVHRHCCCNCQRDRITAILSEPWRKDTLPIQLISFLLYVSCVARCFNERAHKLILYSIQQYIIYVKWNRYAWYFAGCSVQ